MWLTLMSYIGMKRILKKQNIEKNLFRDTNINIFS